MRKPKRKFQFSLKLQLLVILVCGLTVAGGIFFGLKKLGDYYVWKNYVNVTAEQERDKNLAYMNDLQKFVNLNKLKISEAGDTNKWASAEHLNLVFYKDRDLVYFEEETGAEDKNFQNYLSEDDRKKYDETLKAVLEGNADAYPISFMDGTLLVTFVDNTESFMRNMATVISLAVSVLIFTVFMMIYVNNITGRIRRLAKTVKAVGEGDMERKIQDGGNDEISTLAQDVNGMRNSVVENMSKEREAWEANAGLITAMSHDIRTPLTVMMGYMELMELQNEDPTFAEYLESCKQNAHKLKKLSDDMFSYFLVFGRREFELNRVKAQADHMIRHMIEEHCILLAENGYNVSTLWNCSDILVEIDPKYFGRVIDNVFSNIGKYADKTETVSICVSREDDSLIITTTNSIIEDTSGTESNGIGNKTCQKIMEQLGGGFITGEQNGGYVNKIILPISKSE